jgi:hypothetical protein
VGSLRIRAFYVRPHFTARDNFISLLWAEHVLFFIHFFDLINFHGNASAGESPLFPFRARVEKYTLDKIFLHRTHVAYKIIYIFLIPYRP